MTIKDEHQDHIMISFDVSVNVSDGCMGIIINDFQFNYIYPFSDTQIYIQEEITEAKKSLLYIFSGILTLMNVLFFLNSWFIVEPAR